MVKTLPFIFRLPNPHPYRDKHWPNTNDKNAKVHCGFDDVT